MSDQPWQQGPQYGSGGQSGQPGPQGRSQPGQPSYGQPGPQGHTGQPHPGASQQPYRFRMPQSWPRSLQDVLPAGGFGGHIFSQQGVPTLVSIAFWILLVSSALGLVLSVLGLVAMLGVGLFAYSGAVVPALVATVIVALNVVICALQVLLSFKIREASEWARFVLSVLTAVGLIVGAGGLVAGGSGGGMTGLLGIAVVVLLWLPEPNEWFLTSRPS